jgi:hypothetical protein
MLLPLPLLFAASQAGGNAEMPQKAFEKKVLDALSPHRQAALA